MQSFSTTFHPNINSNRNFQRQILGKLFVIIGGPLFAIAAYLDLKQNYILMGSVEILQSILCFGLLIYGIHKKNILLTNKIALYTLLVNFLSGTPTLLSNHYNLIWVTLFPFLVIYLGGLTTGIYMIFIFGLVTFSYYLFVIYYIAQPLVTGVNILQLIFGYSIAAILAVYYEREREKYEIQILNSAERDSLTGLWNRRGMIHIQNHLINDFERGSTFSILIIDLDHFKKINDTCGHDVGDMVLVELSRKLTTLIRKSDWLVRWGGEEFIIFLKNTHIDSAIQTAEKIRSDIENYPFPCINHATISIGAAEFKEGMNFDDLFKKADSLLYQAKVNGRNRVVWKEKNNAKTCL